MAKRYEQMLPLIAKIRPRTIVEVGVHGALRANMLCRRALQDGPVHYTGFDVFETLSASFQKAALNGKGMATEAAARARLDRIVEEYPDTFSYELVIGDTRKTLHGKAVVADFAFIDGDHRVDAIRGDYEALSASKCVVFDDCFLPDAKGGIPDIGLYGANQVVDSITGAKVKVLPTGDRCKHGGFSHLVTVTR